MALVTTAGGATSDSYLSVAEADALAEKDGGAEATAWLDAPDTASKEAALRRATDAIDERVQSGWGPYSLTQALLFPRSIDLSSGTPVIHARVKRATYRVAKFWLTNVRVIEAARTRRARGMQSASEPSTSYSQADSTGEWDVINEIIDDTLGTLIKARSGSRSVRLGTGYVP